MVLFIDTSDLEQLQVGLITSGEFVAQKTVAAKYQQAEKLLPAIEAVLKKAGSSLQQLKGVAVVSGPGPFSALRIGVTTANTLAHELDVPIVAIKREQLENKNLAEYIEQQIQKAKVGSLIEPEYDKEPNITKPKS